MSDVHGGVLLHQAVQQDGEGGEADVVQRQVGSVVQGLRGREACGSAPQHLGESLGTCLNMHMYFSSGEAHKLENSQMHTEPLFHSRDEGARAFSKHHDADWPG